MAALFVHLFHLFNCKTGQDQGSSESREPMLWSSGTASVGRATSAAASASSMMRPSSWAASSS